MPCNDVTETLWLKLNEQDQLVEYRLSKRSCGKAVGVDDLLVEELAGKHSSEVLSLKADDFVSTDQPEEVAFLRLKHLFAIQAGIRVLIGQESGGRLDPLTVAQIEYENDVMTLDADLSVEVITQQIKSCGACIKCKR